MNATPKRFLRPAQVAAKLGCSLPSVWRFVRTIPAFPKPLKLSPRVTVFVDQELDDYASNCPRVTTPVFEDTL